jgi:glycosyltransferase involved in cell wall biosynthesis
MEITLLSVCRNEEESGHIQKFLKWNTPLFDNAVIYDDASTDNTVQILMESGVDLIQNDISFFRNELLIRESLLEEAKRLYPKTDWFIILDMDEILTCTRQEIETLIDEAQQKQCTGISFKLVNLWKSEIYYRIDEYFDKVSKTHLWKNEPNMNFSGESGLHRELHPNSIKRIYKQDSLRILHLGFSTQRKIVTKYSNYKNLGQEGRNLWRLIDERSLRTKNLADIKQSLGSKIDLWLLEANPEEPKPTSLAHYLWTCRETENIRKSQIDEPIVTLICLIYSGIDWLAFAYGELLKLQKEFEKGLVDILFCANDATPEVIEYLKENRIPHIEFNNLNPSEHYISRVYRAYNFATTQAKSKYCLLVNSDMAYSPGFLSKILLDRKDDSFVVARLIESGTLKPGPLAIKKNFGKTIKKFDRKSFYKFAAKKEEKGLRAGGLFMPLLVNRMKFIALGGFPEGNLIPGCIDSYITTGKYEIATPGEICISGDAAFFERAQTNGVSHVTSLRAVAYHFQEGEKRHASIDTNLAVRSGIAIANDSLSGINGEKVLWNLLSEILINNGIKFVPWNTGKISFPSYYLRQIPILKFKPKGRPRICLQNASYLPIIEPEARTISLLQDNLFDTRLRKLQKKVTSFSSAVITNSIPMIDLDSSNHYIWQPLPINSIFLESPKKRIKNGNVGIFVGAFNETKGWKEVREIVISYPQIHFILVSKYEDDCPGPLNDFPGNVSVYRNLSQLELIDLLDEASFFLLGSPLETQCLAAIEALARGVKIVMKNTGLLAESPYSDSLGFFNNDLRMAFSQALETRNNSFEPMPVLEKMRIDPDSLMGEWEEMLISQLEKSFLPEDFYRLTIFERAIRKFRAPKIATRND